MRLFQGDYARETRYSDDPVATAQRWESLGAPRLHVVDLDGARAGSPANQGVMEAICRAVAVPVEVSGGIRDLGAIEAAFAYGASRVQLGSAAVRDPGLVARAVERFAGEIVVSIDCRDGEVRTDGWEQGSGITVHELAARMVAAGVQRIMVTDIGRDSTLTEPNFDLLAGLVRELPIAVVASGGVARVEDIVKLAAIGCEGVIVGKALYEGTVDLVEALRGGRGWSRAERTSTNGAYRLDNRAMLMRRIIPCFDVDRGRVVKGVSFVELRDAGDPVELARLYDREGADELVFLDITASSDDRDDDVRHGGAHRRPGVHPVHRGRRRPQRRATCG